MSTNDAAARQAMHDQAVQRYAARRAAVARKLREIADAFERNAEVSEYDRAFRNHAEVGLYTNAAQRGIHEVMWGIANLHLDSLVEHAGAADAAARPVTETS